MSVDDLRAYCVDNFPRSNSRDKIMAGLQRVISRLTAESIPAAIWIDGSFVSEKIDPGDVDVVLEVDPKDIGTHEQDKVLKQLEVDRKSKALKQNDLCDLYWLVKDFPDPKAYNQKRNYWIDQLGSDSSGTLKGIVTLTI